MKIIVHQVLFRANKKNKIGMCKTNLKVIKNVQIFFFYKAAHNKQFGKSGK